MSSSPTKEIHPSVIAIAKRLHDYNEPALHHVQNTQSNQFGHSKHNEPGVRTSAGFIFVGPSGETDKFVVVPPTVQSHSTEAQLEDFIAEMPGMAAPDALVLSGDMNKVESG